MPERLRDVIGAIADGQPVDWDAVETGAGGERERQRLRTLRTLASVVSAHRTVQPVRGGTEHSGGASRTGRGAGAPLGTWGPYVLVEQLGAGTSADVLRAYDPRLDRDVALKLLTPFYSGRQAGDVVIAEGRHLARVRHPNVAVVFAAERVAGRVGIVMELVEGRSLAEVLRTDGVFTAASVTDVGLQLCDALGAVHGAGLIHRDVKAQNVVREAGGRIVLTDFGTAIGRGYADSGTIAGTPACAAPELFGGADPTPHSDVYSLGVLLFQLLTGVLPVEGSTVAALRAAHREGRRRTLREMRPDVPTSLANAIEKTLSSRPADRFPTVQGLRQALAGTAPGGPRPSGSSPGASSARGWVAVSVLAGAMAGAVWAVTDGTGGTTPRAVAPATALPSMPAGPHGILVARFENATGDPELDQVIGVAVERGLAASRQLHLVSRDRVEDVLRLMKRPSDTPIDTELAREVGQRDGAVRAILVGRIDRLGSRYTIGARALDVVSGRALADLSEDAPAKEQLTRASQRLADRLRVALGDVPARLDAQASLERVTTPSLQALRLYSESYRMGRRNEWPGALALARQAVNEDPGFASAQIWLAWALLNTGASSDAYRPVAERAMALADGTDEVERLWITGSYYRMAGDDARAEEAYLALVQLQPDHPWAVSNLTNLYERQGRPSAALPLVLRVADLRPYDLESNFEAAHMLLWIPGDFDRARPYAERVRAATPSPLAIERHQTLSYGRGPSEVAWAHYVDATERLVRRDVEGVNAEVGRVLGRLQTSPHWLHDELVSRAVQFYLTTGQAGKARVATEQFRERGFPYKYFRAWVAFFTDDAESARQFVRDIEFRPGWHGLTWLKGRLGMADEAERWLRARPAGLIQPNIDELIAGSLRLARGDVDGAIPGLESALAARGPWAVPRIAWDLSAAWLQKGDPDRAIQVLQQSLLLAADSDVKNGGPWGFFWIPNALLLAELCQDRPCRAQGAAIIDDVDRLLSAADPDYPQRRRLDRLKAGAYAGPD